MSCRIHAAVERSYAASTQFAAEFIECFAAGVTEYEVKWSEAIGWDVVHIPVTAQAVQSHGSIEIVKDAAKFWIVENKV